MCDADFGFSNFFGKTHKGQFEIHDLLATCADMRKTAKNAIRWWSPCFEFVILEGISSIFSEEAEFMEYWSQLVKLPENIVTGL